MALTRISSYTKNVAKSFGYVLQDMANDYAPNITSMLKDTKETSKEVYQSIREWSDNNRGSIDERALKGGIKNASRTIWKNFMDDVKTGNWYNKARQDALEMGIMSSAMGGDFNFDDIDWDSDDWGDDDDGWDDQDTAKVVKQETAKSTSQMSAKMDQVGYSISRSINEGTAYSANYIVEANAANTRALYSLTESGFSTMTKALMNVNSSIVNFAQLGQPLTVHMQNSGKFYTNTTEQLNKINEGIQKIVANTTTNEPGGKRSSSRGSSYEDIFSDGKLDIRAWTSMIKENFSGDKEMLDMIKNMFKGVNPKNISVGALLTRGMTHVLIPKMLKDSVKSLDETVKFAVHDLLLKGKNKLEDTGFLGAFLSNMIFPDTTAKTKLNTGNYEKGRVAWDGIARQALTHVIPIYLSKIYSAISGAEETIYDYNSGKFIKMKQVRGMQKAREQKYIEQAGGDFRTKAIAKVNESTKIGKKRLTKADKEKILKEIDEYILKCMNSGGSIDFYDYYNNFESDKFKDFKNATEIRKIFDMVRSEYSEAGLLNKPFKGTGRGMNSSILSASMARSRELRDMETAGNHVESILHDGTYDPDKKYKPGASYSIRDLFMPDEHKNTLMDYMYGIYTILASGDGGRGRRGKGPKRGGPNGAIDPKKYEEFARRAEAEEVKAEKDAAKKKYVDPNTGEERDFSADEVAKEANSLISKWLKKHGLDGLAESSPFVALSNMISTMSNTIADVVWGKNGEPSEGLFGNFKIKMNEFFEDLKKKFDEHWKKFSEKLFGKKGENGQFEGGILSNFVNGTRENLKGAGKWVKGVFKDAWYGKGNAPGEGATAPENGNAANGRRVTRTGLVAVSEGELIIPAELNPFYNKPVNKMKQYRDEANAVKQYYGSYADGNNMFANGILGFIKMLAGKGKEKASDIYSQIFGKADDADKSKKIMNETLSKVFGEAKENSGAMGAGALIGGGVSLLTGAVVGPLFGAAIGAGVGLVIKSKTVQNMLFGDVDEETGDRKGGLFNKELSNFLTKNAPEMAKGALLGGAAGLFMGSPFLGMIVGAGVKYVASSDKAKEFLFGKMGEDGNREGGLVSAETQKQVKARIPGITAGALAGLVAGPFGIAGNLIFGAGLGYLASSEEFQNKLFGEKDKDGKRHGGMLEDLRQKILQPLSEFGINTTKRIGNWLTKVGKSLTSILFKGARGVFGLATGLVKKVFGNSKVAGAMEKIGGGLTNGISGFLSKRAVNSKLKNARAGVSIYDAKLGRNMRAGETIDFLNARGKKIGQQETDVLNYLNSTTNAEQLDEFSDVARMLDRARYSGRDLSAEDIERVRKIGAFKSLFDEQGNFNKKGIKKFNTGAMASLAGAEKKKFSDPEYQQAQQAQQLEAHTTILTKLMNYTKAMYQKLVFGTVDESTVQEAGSGSGNETTTQLTAFGDQIELTASGEPDLSSTQTKEAFKFRDSFKTAVNHLGQLPLIGSAITGISGLLGLLKKKLVGDEKKGGLIDIIKGFLSGESGPIAWLTNMFFGADHVFGKVATGAVTKMGSLLGKVSSGLGPLFNIKTLSPLLFGVIAIMALKGKFDDIFKNLTDAINKALGIANPDGSSTFGDNRKDTDGDGVTDVGTDNRLSTRLLDNLIRGILKGKGSIVGSAIYKAAATVGKGVAPIVRGGIRGAQGAYNLGKGAVAGAKTGIAALRGGTSAVKGLLGNADEGLNLWQKITKLGRGAIGEGAGRAAGREATDRAVRLAASSYDEILERALKSGMSQEAAERFATRLAGNSELGERLIKFSANRASAEAAKQAGAKAGKWASFKAGLGQIGKTFGEGAAEEASEAYIKNAGKEAAEAMTQKALKGGMTKEAAERFSKRAAATAVAEAGQKAAGKSAFGIVKQSATDAVEKAASSNRIIAGISNALDKLGDVLLKTKIPAVQRMGEIIGNIKEAIIPVVASKADDAAEVAAKGASKGFKIASLFAIGPVDIAIAAADAVNGWTDAANILQITTKPTIGQKAIAATIAGINSLIPIIGGFIPNSLIVNILIKVCKKLNLFPEDIAELEEQRAKAVEIAEAEGLTVEQYNMKHGNMGIYKRVGQFAKETASKVKNSKFGQGVAKFGAGVKSGFGKMKTGLSNIGKSIKENGLGKTLAGGMVALGKNVAGLAKKGLGSLDEVSGFTELLKLAKSGDLKGFYTYQTKNVSEDDGPMAKIAKNILPSMAKYFLAPVALVSSVGHKIGEFFTKTKEKIVATGNFIKEQYEYGQKYFDTDDEVKFTDYMKIPEPDPENPIGGVAKAAIMGTRLLGVGSVIAKFIGNKIGDKFKEIGQKILGAWNTFTGHTTNILDFVKKGQPLELLKYGTSFDKENPVGGLMGAVLAIEKNFTFVPAAISWAGHKVVEKFKIIADKVSAGFEEFKGHSGNILELVKQGEPLEILKYGTSFDKENPVGPLMGGLLSIEKNFVMIPAAISWGGHRIYDFVTNTAEHIKTGWSELMDHTTNLFDLVKQGEPLKLLAYATPFDDEENPVGPIMGGILGAEKYFMIIPSAISWAGHKIGDAFDKIVGGTKIVLQNYDKVRREIAQKATDGSVDVKGLWAINAETNADEGNPLAPFTKISAFISKLTFTPAVFINHLGKSIKDKLDQTSGKIAPDAALYNTAREEMDRMADEGNISGLLNYSAPNFQTSVGKVFSIGYHFTRVVDIIKALFNSIVKKFSIDNLFGKLRSLVKADRDERTSGGGSGVYAGGDSGVISQTDPRYASKSLGNSTVGQIGCGPAVASMVAQGYGKNFNMNQAISSARPYQIAGGTELSYFDDVLGRQGIGTQTIDRSQVMSSLANGQQVILAGQDPSNRSKVNSPFGPRNHYVVASGTDMKGRIIIKDPESNRPIAYDPSILNAVQYSVRTGAGSGLRRRRGRYAAGATQDVVQRILAAMEKGETGNSGPGFYFNMNGKDGTTWNYGIASFTKEYAMDGLMSYLRSNYPNLANQLQGEVGSDEFNNSWAALGATSPNEFYDAQANYVLEHNILGPIQKIKENFGVDLNNGQYSEGLISILNTANNWAPAFYSKNGTKSGIGYKNYFRPGMSNEEAIEGVYKTLIDRTNALNSSKFDKGWRNRWERERQEAYALTTPFQYTGGTFHSSGAVSGTPGVHISSGAQNIPSSVRASVLANGGYIADDANRSGLTSPTSAMSYSDSGYSNGGYNSGNYGPENSDFQGGVASSEGAEDGEEKLTFGNILSKLTSAFTDFFNGKKEGDDSKGGSINEDGSISESDARNMMQGEYSQEQTASDSSFSSSSSSSVLGTANGGTTGSIINNFPYFNQGESPWGTQAYGNSTVGKGGCGPTSMAMVMKSYGIQTDPGQTANWSVEHGHRVDGQGTAWSFFPAIGKQTGLDVSESTSMDFAKENLNNNIPVIASMKPGDFTTGGHFIVLSGKKGDDGLLVNDPNSREKSGKVWAIDNALSQAKRFWAISKDGKGSIGVYNSIPETTSGINYSTDSRYAVKQGINYATDPKYQAAKQGVNYATDPKYQAAKQGINYATDPKYSAKGSGIRAYNAAAAELAKFRSGYSAAGSGMLSSIGGMFGMSDTGTSPTSSIDTSAFAINAPSIPEYRLGDHHVTVGNAAKGEVPMVLPITSKGAATGDLVEGMMEDMFKAMTELLRNVAENTVPIKQMYEIMIKYLPEIALASGVAQPDKIAKTVATAVNANLTKNEQSTDVSTMFKSLKSQISDWAMG